jgi:hypothetical protein
MATKIPLVLSAGRVQQLQAGDSIDMAGDAYLLVDGTKELTGNLAVTATKTVDGRDVSVDGTALDLLVGYGNHSTQGYWQNNVIINGGFDFYQRAASFTAFNSVAEDVYCFDRWYMLTQTAAGEALRWNIAGATGAQPGPFVGILQQHQAAAQRIGIAQIIEGMNSFPLRGRTITLQAKVACVQTDMTLRYAILEWTGTCDTVTSDVVLDWTSGTYTANNFFLAAGLTVVAVGSTALTHVDAIASAVPVAITLAGTVSASCNNLIILFWSEGTMAQHDQLVLSEVDCHIGASRIWSPRPVAQELALCQRYYQKIRSDTANAIVGMGIAHNTTNIYGFVIPLVCSMRTPPSEFAYSSLSGLHLVNTSDIDPTALSLYAQLENTGTLLVEAVGFTATLTYKLIFIGADDFLSYGAEL